MNLANLQAVDEPEPARQPLPARWEHFDHGADIGVRGFGPTKAAAFEQVALAVTALVTSPESVMARETLPIWCEAADDELLLAGWLHALVSEMGCRRMLFGRFHVEALGEGRLTASASGEHTCATRHRPALEPKGVTYTALRLAPIEGGWMAQAVVDI